MSKSKTAKPLPEHKRRELEMLAIAKSLPTGTVELLAVCRMECDAYGAAVLADDGDAVAAARLRYKAAVWVLNDGTMFGSFSGPESGGELAARHCAALPGSLPGWGQKGEFLIEVDGMRAVVCYGSQLTTFSTHFEFHAIDLDRPFVSDSGYRSHFVNGPTGSVTVAFAAEAYLRGFVRDHKVTMIRRDAHIRDMEPCFLWLEDATLPMLAPPVVAASGQLGFSF